MTFVNVGQDESSKNDIGNPVEPAFTPEGHQEVAIHDPILPFGAVHTENLTPIFQTDAVYQLNEAQVQTTVTGTGAVTASATALFQCATGATIYSAATLQSRKRLRYRPGQGVVGRFTAMFTTPVASSYQVAGLGHAEDGYFFGYQNTTFGILKSSGGKREIQTLTINTASSTAENVTVTLGGTAYTVAVTNSANVNRTAWEISRGSFGAWNAEAVGSTVRFINGSVGDKTGTFSLSGTTAAGTFAETRAGTANTDTFIAQSTWNGDKLDGTGASGITLDPTKLNLFQINIAYLGAGAVVFKVMVAGVGGNNPTWVVVHSINNPNTMTQPHVLNPSFPFTMAAYSAGSTTNLVVSSASFAGFIGGNKKLHGNRMSYENSLTTVGATNIQALFTVKNDRVFAGKASQVVVNLLSISGAIKHTSPVIYYLIKNGTLTGNPNFASPSSVSATTWDTAATTVSFSDRNQIIWTGHLGDTGELDHHFNGGGMEEVTLQPGEYVTLGAKATTGTPSYVTGSINTREDQ